MIHYGPGQSIVDLSGTLRYDTSRSLGGVGVLVYDTFTDADGTLLTAHTPDIAPAGSVWQALPGAAGGSCVIKSNRAATSGASLSGNIIECGVANCTITSVVRTITGAGSTIPLGVIARATEFNNRWSIGIRRTDNVLCITETNGGIITTRAAAAFTATNNTDYTLVVVLDGQSITGTIGATSVSYASAALNAAVTTHGVLCRDTTTNANDDFQVVG